MSRTFRIDFKLSKDDTTWRFGPLFEIGDAEITYVQFLEKAIECIPMNRYEDVKIIIQEYIANPPSKQIILCSGGFPSGSEQLLIRPINT